MKGLIIQQIHVQELQELLRTTVKEELSKFQFKVTEAPASEQFELFSKKEAASFLKISLPTLSRLVKSGEIKAFRLGKNRYRFRKSDLQHSLTKIKM